jgi:group I intron endonuclease
LQKRYWAVGIVYSVTNNDDGTIYIGKTTQEMKRRIYNHFADVRRGSRTHFHNALRKYGPDHFTWSVFEVVPDQLAGYIERGWIGLYRAMGCRLYNQTDGGDGCWGVRHSTATKLKIGQGNKGKIISDEARLRVAEANRRRIWTEEASAKHALTSSGDKVYTLVSPDGTKYTNVVNFKGFCRKHNIASRSLWRAIHNNRPLLKGSGKGWAGQLQESLAG